MNGLNKLISHSKHVHFKITLLQLQFCGGIFLPLLVDLLDIYVDLSIIYVDLSDIIFSPEDIVFRQVDKVI